MASTTSTEQSGLFGHLLPAFKQATRHRRAGRRGRHRPGARHGRRGDADVLFVHDKAAEEKFVAEGFAAKRFPVMYNDFVLVGPKSDPAGVKGNDIVAALKKLGAPATRRSSRAATRAARTPPSCATGRRPASTWPPAKPAGYKECGCGMGPALNIGRVQRRLRAGRPRHLAQLQEPRRPGRAGRRRQAPVQPVRRDGRQPGQASARQGGAGAAVRRLGGLAGGAGRRSPSYKIGGEQLFFPNADR